MKIWKVEVWLRIEKDSHWENWQNEYVACETIQEAIEKALAKQKAEWKPKAIEVRTAMLETESTIQ